MYLPFIVVVISIGAAFWAGIKDDGLQDK